MKQLKRIREELNDQFIVKEDVNTVQVGKKSGFSVNLSIKTLVNESVKNPQTGLDQTLTFPRISVTTIGMGESEEGAREDAYNNVLEYIEQATGIGSLKSLGNFEISETLGELSGNSKMFVDFALIEEGIKTKQVTVSSIDQNRKKARDKSLGKLLEILGV